MIAQSNKSVILDVAAKNAARDDSKLDFADFTRDVEKVGA